MGAWGLSLFQCDLGFDLLQELNEETGLPELEKRAGKKASSIEDSPARRRQAENAKLRESSPDREGAKFRQMPKPAPEQNAHGTSYSLYAKLCSDPEKVRAHLDNTGALSSIMGRFHGFMLDCRVGGLCDADLLHDCYGPGYAYCLIGACAMTLGAKLSDKERDIMRKHYRDVGMMRDAVKQLEKALDGYVNGVPWDFGSKGLQDTLRVEANLEAHLANEEGLLFPGTGMINTWAPDHGRRKEEMISLKSTFKRQVASMKPTPEQLAKCLEALNFDGYAKKPQPSTSSNTQTQTWPDDVCGGCGAKKCADGEELLDCSKCKKRRYCSPQCQKKDWKTHKTVCKPDWPSDLCGGCGAAKRYDGEELDACSKCVTRLYCSRECHKKDWKAHKLVCKAADATA